MHRCAQVLRPNRLVRTIFLKFFCLKVHRLNRFTSFFETKCTVWATFLNLLYFLFVRNVLKYLLLIGIIFRSAYFHDFLLIFRDYSVLNLIRSLILFSWNSYRQTLHLQLISLQWVSLSEYSHRMQTFWYCTSERAI